MKTKTLNVSEQEYFTWCLGKLSANEYIVYKACEFVGPMTQISMADIGTICNMHQDTIRRHMKQLQTLKFLYYHSTGGDKGTTILWVRSGIAEEPPQKGNLLQGLSITLWGPDKKPVKIVPGFRGGIAGFCKKHAISRRCVYRLLSGDLKTCKGWTA